MSTITALFNPQQDHQLVRLSLQETKTHTFLTQTSFHCSPTTPSSPKYTLVVPHLNFPWATTLCDTLYRTLHISLNPIQTSTRPLVLPRDPSNFYDRIIPPHSWYNRRTLAAIHAAHPGILPRLAVFVKLAYCNTLLHSLNNLRNKVTNALSRTNAPPQPPTKAVPVAPRPGAAESGRVVPTPKQLARKPPTLPQPPPNPSTVARITAHSLPNHRGAPSAFLLHGVSVPAPLLITTVCLLRAYGILVEVPVSHPPATLLNLSNRVSPSLGVDRTPTPGRGPRLVDDPVDKFVLRAYAISWPKLCTAVVREARQVVEKQRLTSLRGELVRLQIAVKECHKIRETLVKDAIAMETAGSSLANMCAFVIAQTDKGEFESDYGRFGRECVRQVEEARHRIWQLSTEETRSAAVLVAGMRNGREHVY